MVAYFKEKNPSKWYNKSNKAIKRMTSYDNQDKEINVDKISPLVSTKKHKFIMRFHNFVQLKFEKSFPQ